LSQFAGTLGPSKGQSQPAQPPIAHDQLGAARGLMVALVLAVPFWAAILALVLYLTR
jgi:hypothetical protein